MTSTTTEETWSSEVFTDAVGDAVCAPSIHNSQPWRFRRTGDGVDVLLDDERRPAICDPDGRMARISCGAAVYTLRLAFAAAGRPAHHRLGRGHVLAHLWPAPARPPAPADLDLHRQIRRRHTNRGSFADRSMAPGLPAVLAEAAWREGGRLTFLEDEQTLTLAAGLIRRADSQLRADPAYMAELRAWSTMADNRVEGIGRLAAGAAPHPDELLTRRDFGGVCLKWTRDPTRSPVVAVLGVQGDGPIDAVRAGMALQGVLLTATALGLATAMYSQAIEVAHIRAQLRHAVGDLHDPQLVLRFGYAPTCCYTSRRPVDAAIVA